MRLICSTVSEIENLFPWLLECKARGKVVDVRIGRLLSAKDVIAKANHR